MKEKYAIEIADVQLSILSDEKEDFVKAVVSRLDQEVRDLTVRNKRCSKQDAALLCALDYCAEKIKADKRIRNLEAQISLYDANMRRLREENAALTAAAAATADTPKKADEPAAAPATAPAEPVQETIVEPPARETPAKQTAPEGKLRQLELMLRGIRDSGEQ